MEVLLRNGDSLERVHVDGDVAIVGRTPQCDVVVGENYVSKQHLKIFQGVVVVDLGSANGSFIDDEPILAPTLLSDRSVRLGKGDLTLEVETFTGLDTIPQDGGAGAARVAQLESENLELRRQLEARDHEVTALRAELEELRAEAGQVAQTAGPSEPVEAPPLVGDPTQADPSEDRSELDVARQAILEMQQRLRSMAGGGSKPAPTPVTPPPARKRVSSPRQATPVPAAGPGADNTADLIARLATEDVLGVSIPDDASLHDFMIVESFRFLRRVEKVVTRMAGELIQLYQMNTILPDVEANLRTAMRELAAQPMDPNARSQFVEYLRETGRWLVVSLSSYRKAAARFADVLCHDLSEEALVGDQGISAFKKKEAELWRRASQYIKDLTPDYRTERIEKYAREVASEMIESGNLDM